MSAKGGKRTSLDEKDRDVLLARRVQQLRHAGAEALNVGIAIRRQNRDLVAYGGKKLGLQLVSTV
jgi:hypothetical protein